MARREYSLLAVWHFHNKRLDSGVPTCLHRDIPSVMFVMIHCSLTAPRTNSKKTAAEFLGISGRVELRSIIPSVIQWSDDHIIAASSYSSCTGYDSFIKCSLSGL